MDTGSCPENGGSAQRAYIRTLPFEQALEYCLIRGPFIAYEHSKVWGITLLDSPFYSNAYGFDQYERVTVVAPWWGNCNGFFLAEKFPERTASVTKSACFVHDDIFDLAEYYGPHDFTENVIGSIGSASYFVSYWPHPDSGTTHEAVDNTVVCLNFAVPDAGSIVLAWCDGSSTSEVVDGILIEDCDFVGSVINGRPFDLRHKAYPYDPSLAELQLGQIQDFTFRNITFETVPTVKSIIQGKDANNKVRRVAFENVWYASTRLTAGNFLDYFEINEFVEDITVDGVRVDMIQTTGAATVQSRTVATSSLLIDTKGVANVSAGAAGSSNLGVLGAYGMSTVAISALGTSSLLVSMNGGASVGVRGGGGAIETPLSPPPMPRQR